MGAAGRDVDKTLRRHRRIFCTPLGSSQAVSFLQDRGLLQIRNGSRTTTWTAGQRIAHVHYSMEEHSAHEMPCSGSLASKSHCDRLEICADAHYIDHQTVSSLPRGEASDDGWEQHGEIRRNRRRVKQREARGRWRETRREAREDERTAGLLAWVASLGPTPGPNECGAPIRSDGGPAADDVLPQGTIKSSRIHRPGPYERSILFFRTFFECDTRRADRCLVHYMADADDVDVEKFFAVDNISAALWYVQVCLGPDGYSKPPFESLEEMERYVSESKEELAFFGKHLQRANAIYEEPSNNAWVRGSGVPGMWMPETTSSF